MSKINIKEELENYNETIVRINFINYEIHEIKIQIPDLKSPQTNELHKTKGFVESNVERQILDKLEKIEEKEKEKKELEYKLEIVDGLIKTLKKSDQEIIKRKFLEKDSIEQIATDKEKTSTTIYRTIERSIKKMQREIDRSLREKDKS